MTPYQLHKAGGPDPKSIKKVLEGKPVSEVVLSRLIDGLSLGPDTVSLHDIPND